MILTIILEKFFQNLSLIHFMKYWQILLIEQRKRGKSGLTIPFIIGSQFYLIDPLLKKQEISDLINEISVSDLFETCLRYCTDTKSLILEIRATRNAVYYPLYNGLEQKNLSIAVSFDNLGDNVDDLITKLECDYNKPISDNTFSA